MSNMMNKGSPDFVTKEIGERLKRKRLNRNLSQEELGSLSNTSRNIVKNAEKGSTSLVNLIAVLKALDELDQLDAFLYEPDISPVEVMKLQGKVRQRASGAKDKGSDPTTARKDTW
ncbi:MAG: putative transcriptional regulator [Paraglaciecola sp.]|jgi:putative transcriptional regulator